MTRDAIVCEVLRKNNSKIMKRTHPNSRLTMEKGSLDNKVRRDRSGYARTMSIDVSNDEEGYPVLSMRNTDPKEAGKPDMMWKSVVLSGGVRKALLRAEKLLAAYPPPMRNAALAKVSAVYKAQLRKNRGVNHTALLTAAPAAATSAAADS